MSEKSEMFEQLMEMREMIKEQITEVDAIMRDFFPNEYHNAEVYWIAHIKSALGGMGYHTYSTTFQSCMEQIEESLYKEDNGFEEDEEEFED